MKMGLLRRVAQTSISRAAMVRRRLCSKASAAAAVLEGSPDAASVETGAADVDAPRPPGPGTGQPFPWRAKSSTNESTAGLLSMTKLAVAKSVVEELYDVPFEEIERGAAQAFRAVSQSIFQSPPDHQAMPLPDVAEARLAAFYSDALSAAKKEAVHLKYKATVEDTATLVDSELLLWGKRGAHFNHVSRKPLLFGMSFFSLNGPPDASTTFADWESNPDVRRSRLQFGDLRRLVCVRLVFDVKVSESFSIVNSEGAVVQGSDESKETTHSLVIESVVTSVDPQGPSGSGGVKTSDWAVVDIDQWLQGNRFWVANHKKM